MDRIQAARVFVEIVDKGSMVAAADHLDMSRSMVTRYLNEIESWANARLLHRSTRRLSLTQEGESVLSHCYTLLAAADDIPAAIQPSEDAVSGHLRIACAHFAAEHTLLPILERYSALYPDVTIELQINNASVDLVAERIDLALRISADLDPNLIARPLGKCISVLCASPDYLKQSGIPKVIDDLKQHQCLVYSHFGKHGMWRFIKEGEPHSFPISGRLIASDSEILMKAALKHMGITYQPKADVQSYLDSGELVEVLPAYKPIELGIFAVYRSRKHMPVALRLLLDMLAEAHIKDA